ncbi:MAG: hypothetical protein AAFV88_23340 [Planctomycetota bacterium]
MMTSTTRAALPAMLALLLCINIGCNISIGHDPEKSVTVEISGISTDTDRESVSETLKEFVDGSSHVMTSSYAGDSMSITLSPVTDVQAFADKIDFGEVQSVEERTVTVTYGE